MEEAKGYRDSCKQRAADWAAAHPQQDKQQRVRRMRKLPPQAPAGRGR